LKKISFLKSEFNKGHLLNRKKGPKSKITQEMLNFLKEFLDNNFTRKVNYEIIKDAIVNRFVI